MRYKAYGVIPKEHEDDNRDLSPGSSPDAQKVAQEEVLYETDDRDEARTIKQNGGFVKDEKFFAVTRVVDSQAGEGAPSGGSGKHDVDQPLSKGQ